MVRAWFMDDDVDLDQRLEHHRNPPEFVELCELLALTGVEYFKVSERKSSISKSLRRLLHGFRMTTTLIASRKCALMHFSSTFSEETR